MKNKKLDLNEEISRIKSLINFNYSNNLISEQGEIGGNIGVGISGKEKDKKASQEDIASLTEDSFAEEIKEVANKPPQPLKIDDEVAKSISRGIVAKAQVRGSKMNKIFRRGLLNGTLNIKKTNEFSNVELNVLGTSMKPNDLVFGSSIKGSVDKTETPEIPLYDIDKNVLMSSVNPEDIASWVLNQNVESFKKGEQQYYLVTFGTFNGVDKPMKKGFFMAVKGDVPVDGIVTVGVTSKNTQEGTTTPGGTLTTKTPVDLVVELSEAFTTGFSTFKDNDSARQALITKIGQELTNKGYINLDINSINVISSASNYYVGIVDFTHDKGGNVTKTGINFNNEPTKTDKKNVDANNKLAWERGQRLLTLLKGINGQSLGGDLGVVTIHDGASETVEWRVTDTDGKVDPAGAEGSGQYAKLFISGVAQKVQTEDIEPTITPGSNKGNLTQAIIYVDSDKLEGGIRLASWFQLYQSKYDPTGKRNPRMTGTFRGLPKWLDNIIYK